MVLLPEKKAGHKNMAGHAQGKAMVMEVCVEAYDRCSINH
jgi:hypothetical protein